MLEVGRQAVVSQEKSWDYLPFKDPTVTANSVQSFSLGDGMSQLSQISTATSSDHRHQKVDSTVSHHLVIICRDIGYSAALERLVETSHCFRI